MIKLVKAKSNLFHRLILLMMIFSLLLQSCNRCPPPFEPQISYFTPDSYLKALPTPFKPLNKDELLTLWGKELYLGVCFSEEQDWYRAITALKSSLFLIPKKSVFEPRIQQIEFYICLCYYFAGKYKEAYETYEASSLFELNDEFPARRELYLLLTESYAKCFFHEKSEIFKSKLFPQDQAELDLGQALISADFKVLYQHEERPSVNAFLLEYVDNKKSVEKAKTLQAILPGAGYYYVGQKKAAVTSFIINALFLAAGIQFMKRGYVAASLITFSLETGWYFGGINGAGLAANEHNERLYENAAKEVLFKEKLFPILRFEYAF